MMLPALIDRIPEMEEWKDFSRQDIEDAETIFGALAPKTRVSYMNHLKLLSSGGISTQREILGAMDS